MTTIADDNTPYKRFVEQAEVSVPNAVSGGYNMFIDSADGVIKKKDSSGIVTIVGSSNVDNTAYGTGWNGDTTYAPTKNSVYDKVETLVSDDVYGVGWNGVTGTSPSKNAVYDKVQSLVSDTAYGAGWNGDTTAAPSKNAVYDKIETVLLSSGALVLLEQHTATGSATLDFTSCISSTYDDYQVEFVSLIPATNNVELQLQVSTDGGSTWKSGASDYEYQKIGMGAGGLASTGSAGSSTFSLATSIATTASRSTNGTMRVFDPLNTGVHTALHSQINSIVSSSYMWFVSGVYATTTAVDGLRFFFSSGDITSGTIRVYGIVK